MTMTLCSMVRNAEHYLDRYMGQINALHDLYPTLRVVLGEGDHTDDTSQRLHLFSPAWVEIVDVSHGGPQFGSIDHPQRWDQIATCVRTVLDKAYDPGVALIWMEADLLWTPLDIGQLLADLHHVPAVAPALMANGETRWYDYWGYRNNGHKFLAQPPYWHEPVEREGEFIKIDSCGSCFVASPHVYDALWEWSGHWPARVGGELWLDPRVQVRHP